MRLRRRLPTHDWTTSPVVLTVLALTTSRLTRLITADTLPPLQDAREALTARLPDRYQHGLTCPWCVSPWAAALLVTAAELAHRRGHGRVFLAACLPFALSTVAGVIADSELG